MLRAVARVIVLLLLCQRLPSLWAQESQPNARPRTVGRDVSRVVQGTTHVLSAPWRWDEKDWLRFGAVLGGTFALSYLDERTNEFFQRNQSRTADRLAKVGEAYGEPRTVVVLTGGVYALGLLGRSEWLRDSAVILAGALLPAGGIQSATKMIAGRARPHVGRGHAVFDPFRREEAYYSFFSGHSMVAMATSHVFARRLNSPVARIGLYGLGALTGLSRMYGEDHWLTDVTLGGVLAVASVNSVAHRLAAQDHPRAHGLQWHIQPLGRGAQLLLAW